MSQKLRGFVAQGMNGQRRSAPLFAAAPISATTGGGTVTIRRPCWALIALWGGGGGSYVAGGGGGGAALYKRIKLNRGAVLTWSCGAGGVSGDDVTPTGGTGGDTTVVLPNGTTLRAGGGTGGAPIGNVVGLAGVATGGDINRGGGAGGIGGNAPPATAGSAGEGPGAGAGGAVQGTQFGGGGGGAGLGDILPEFIGGAGSAADVQSGNTGGLPGSPPGGGAGAGNRMNPTGQARGANGLVYIAFVNTPG